MNRNLTWKFLLVVFVVLWSVWEIYPPKPRDLLEEFKSRAENVDTNFQAIVRQAEELEKQFPERTFVNLMQAVGTNQITNYFPSINIGAERDANRAVLHRIQQLAAGEIKLGLDLQGGTEFLVQMDTNQLSAIQERSVVLAQAVEVLRKRVDRLGVTEPVLQPSGEDQIRIQMPGLSESETQSARKTIEKAAFLEFRMVHEESDALISQGLTAPGYEMLQTQDKDSSGRDVLRSYLVKKKAERGLTGKNVKNAGVYLNPVTGEPGITFTLDSQGAEIFAQITRENLGRQLAIVLDGELYSAPVIRSEIPSGSGEITGSFTIQEAYELANVLENPLEAPVQIIQERRVDPSLGQDSIRSGIKAAIIGTVAVAVFMVAYYLFAGLVANVALVLNIIILLGVLCSFDATLTLPGIAGIVLTIGMAVDANVLIFERIREESKAGKSLRGALAAGYNKAFGTIFDANVTTLIASVILLFMGTGPVQGFGVTLTIGVCVSMFTALLVTRLIFDWLLARNWLKSLPMLRFFKESHLDFLRGSKIAFAVSWVVILIGIGYGLYRGKQVMGVEFAGGDSLTLRYLQSQEVPVDQLRETISQMKIGEPLIQYTTDLSQGIKTLQITTAFGTGDKVETALKEKFSQAKFQRVAFDQIGPSVGKEIQKSALIAIFLSMLGILFYVAMRYEFSFAVGAVVAILHDVLMALGCFFLSGRELSATTVAAVLTIIGFSINDTIVIFDRIREDLKLGLRGSFKELMNQALNQTLSRTIITSGTVFLSTLSLYIFGGGVINDFAFTFLVGIITGTYSSIYIASSLVLWWHKGERPKTGSQVVMDHMATARV